MDDTDPDTDVTAETVDVAACLRDPTCHHLLIAAHRGYHAVAPENSLAAVRATATLGAHLAEVDVRETADGQLVLMHDDKVDRTTDGAGSVSELTLAQLAELTLNDGTDDESSRIPTFAAALELAVELGIGVYVDTKTSRVDLVVQAIRGAGAQDLALVRKDFGALGPALDDGLLLLAPADTVEAFQAFSAQLPDDAWVEIADPSPKADLASAVAAAGFRTQQDVFLGDAPWVLEASYSGWERYLATGVQILQSEFPDGLVQGLADGALPPEPR